TIRAPSRPQPRRWPSPARQDHNNKGTMEFHDRNQPFAVRTKSDEGQEFSGFIVPLAIPEEAQQPREHKQEQAAGPDGPAPARLAQGGVPPTLTGSTFQGADTGPSRACCA